MSENWWNDHGQLLRTIDPEGNVTTFEYYPERDPDGDLVASISPWRVVGALPLPLSGRAGACVRWSPRAGAVPATPLEST